MASGVAVVSMVSGACFVCRDTVPVLTVRLWRKLMDEYVNDPTQRANRVTPAIWMTVYFGTIFVYFTRSVPVLAVAELTGVLPGWASGNARVSLLRLRPLLRMGVYHLRPAACCR